MLNRLFLKPHHNINLTSTMFIPQILKIIYANKEPDPCRIITAEKDFFHRITEIPHESYKLLLKLFNVIFFYNSKKTLSLLTVMNDPETNINYL